MTKKSTEELVAEAQALKKRLEAIRELNEVKKQRDSLEKEVRDLHRATSLKWKGLKKAGSLGKMTAKFFIDETRKELLDDEEKKPKTKKQKEEEGESLL